MATPPTFSAGAVLTAAQMNAVGLWEIKSQTIGTGVTSVEVTGAFSGDFDSYLITISGGSSSSEGDGRLQIGNAATGYYGSWPFVTYATGAQTIVTDNNQTLFRYAWRPPTTSLQAAIWVYAPYLAELTWFHSFVVGTTVSGPASGYLNNTTSYTSFTISPSVGTLTGGTIRVYGLRN